MKAAVCTRYGPPDVLQVREVEKPAPKNNEVLIRVIATSVTSSDTIVRGFKLKRWSSIGFMMGLILGFRAPRQPILGMVFSGEIEAVGQDVDRFQVGDQVFGSTVKNSIKIRFGAYAEYMTLPQDWMIVPKPSNLTHVEAAAIPYGGSLALFFLREGGIDNAQTVLINGASGAVGTSAVQLAIHFGAAVTGVCSTANLELVRSLGADAVIDYTVEDIAQHSGRYDLILDAVPMAMADRKGFQGRFTHLLKPGGTYLSVDTGSPQDTIEDFFLLKELSESGEIRAVIDRCYPLVDIVSAHRHVETGHKKGNVIVQIVDG